MGGVINNSSVFESFQNSTKQGMIFVIVLDTNPCNYAFDRTDSN